MQQAVNIFTHFAFGFQQIKTNTTTRVITTDKEEEEK